MLGVEGSLVAAGQALRSGTSLPIELIVPLFLASGIFKALSRQKKEKEEETEEGEKESEVEKKKRDRMNTKLAVQYVKKNGNEEQKNRLESVLSRKKAKESYWAELEPIQNLDGGFPYGLVAGRPSTMMDTLVAFIKLDELNSLEGDLVEKAVRFLFLSQHGEGSWQEPKEIEQFNPPPWMESGDVKAKLFTTAYTAFWLARLGYSGDERVLQACDFLLKFAHPDGHILGFIHTNWIAASVLAMCMGKDHWSVRGITDYMMEIQEESWVASQVAWLLWSLACAGFTKEDDAVKYFLSILSTMQWSDGSFQSEEEGGEVEATMEVIKALKLLEAMEET